MNKKIPKSLRTWFLIHFIIDMVFAIPLIFIPEIVLPIIDWTPVDPVSTRLVGAALFGIGVESLLSRNAQHKVYKTMLDLKILWSSSAIIGLSLAIALGAPIISWLFWSIFVIFFFVWAYYRVNIFESWSTEIYFLIDRANSFHYWSSSMYNSLKKK